MRKNNQVVQHGSCALITEQKQLSTHNDYYPGAVGLHCFISDASISFFSTRISTIIRLTNKVSFHPGNLPYAGICCETCFDVCISLVGTSHINRLPYCCTLLYSYTYAVFMKPVCLVDRRVTPCVTIFPPWQMLSVTYSPLETPLILHRITASQDDSGTWRVGEYLESMKANNCRFFLLVIFFSQTLGKCSIGILCLVIVIFPLIFHK